MASYIKRKNIKYFPVCASKKSCEKVKCIWRAYFPDAITTNMQNANDSLVFK